jgi:hypothetical protein
MGLLKLRRYAERDMQRLGQLLAKVKESVASESEQEEVLNLLKSAQRVSDSNARLLAELRDVELPPPPDPRARPQAKRS